MSIKVALIGNPNVGKSTLFNRLTGLKQRIGNYPGTTVDKRLGVFRVEEEDIVLYDFPGTYSLYPKSADEEVVFDILSRPNHPDFPDKVFVVGHPLRLKRSLLLFKQVQDLGIPAKFVVNMIDEAQKYGQKIDRKKLENFTKSEVIYTNARNGEGVDLLKKTILKDFDIAENTFVIPSIYSKAIQEVKGVLDIDNDYLAYQIVAQGKGGFSEEKISEIERIKKKFGLVSGRLQVAETIQRFKDIDRALEGGISSIERSKKTFIDKLDDILTHQVFGYLIFFGILLFVFQAIFSWAEMPMNYIDEKFGLAQSYAKELLGEGPLASLLADGIIPGIGGIVIFVPQITILIFFLLLLEETGYMSRVVFLMDKWMKPFGLSGKSIVPLMSGAACAIPGIMAARNIENTKERLITVLVTPLMTCSARLPVYSILIALVIPSTKIYGINLKGLVLMGLYFIGFGAALMFSLVFKKTLKSNYKSYLIMEMPEYHIPHWRNLFLGLWEKVSAFVFGAGRIILAISVILWVLSSWGPTDNFKNANDIIGEQAIVNHWNEIEIEHHVESYKLEYSLLGHLGKTIEPVFKPLGYDWKISIGVLSSFAAREVFVSTMGSIYSLGSTVDQDGGKIIDRMENERFSDGRKVFNLASGVSLLLFYAFAMQCASTLAVVRRETGTWKWPLIQLLFMSTFAYFVAFLAYQLLK